MFLKNNIAFMNPNTQMLSTLFSILCYILCSCISNQSQGSVPLLYDGEQIELLSTNQSFFKFYL